MMDTTLRIHKILHFPAQTDAGPLSIHTKQEGIGPNMAKQKAYS